MASIDPTTGKLGRKKAAHLLKRATFGPSKKDIDQFADMTINEAMDILLQDQPLPDPPKDEATNEDWLPKPTEENNQDLALFRYFKAWFLELMRKSSNNLKERMVYFLHTHLPADYTLIRNSTSLYYQNELFRRYAFGSFKTLFGKVCVDNAMLIYIDNTLNRKDSPNENFAREMLELYTIGKGEQIGPEDYTNYTETDIKAAAKVLTGFQHNFNYDMVSEPLREDPDTGLPRGIVEQVSQHDPGIKQFTDKFNNTTIQPPELINGYATKEGAFDELNQMMDMIFDQEETAKFICRKLYRFFVYYKIDERVENEVIVPLATTFKNNNYEFPPVLRQLFSSKHFFDEDISETQTHHVGAQIKSPIDLVLGTFRFFNVDIEDSNLINLYHAYNSGILRFLKLQGLNFYRPIDVAGYPPYHQTPAYNRNWISPNWLANRYYFANQMIKGVDNEAGVFMFKLDFVAYVKEAGNISDPSNAETLVNELIADMFPQDIPEERFNYFLNTVFMGGDMLSHWTDEWNQYINSNDDTTVRGRLEKLLKGLMQSPEYQLS